MTSPQQLNLERPLDQFRRELTDAQRAEISGANRIVINHEIQKIQTKLGREKGLCRLGRMTKFLDAMEEIEKLITIFLNVSEAVAFIWGPIKLVLMLATTWTNSVKNIIDVYEEIATALDNLAVFHNLIRDNDQLKRMLEDYVSDILRFHRSILAVFSKPDWKRFFVFIWGEFRRSVKPIIESLKRKQAMLSDDKLQQHAILKTLQHSDSYAKDQFEQIHSDLGDVLTLEQLRRQQQQNEEIKLSLEKKLNVSLSQTSSQLELPDTIIESSGSWILSDPRFKSWEDNKSLQQCVLFLNGCPGAGKSTLARIIIRHLNNKRSEESQSQSRSPLFYFFFKHNDSDRRSTRSMLCHIITQIIHSDDAMMRFVYDKCSTLDYLQPSLLKGLATDCLLFQQDPIIVLDGLDEAKDNETANCLKWCLYDLLQIAKSQGRHVRILVCGQEDGRIEPFLSSYPQIRLHTLDPHMKDIEEYCRDRASVISSRFRLLSDDEKDLVVKVSKAAKGMFLYAKVVLANLIAMGSRKEFKAELKDNEFPRNLDEAYERILQRIIYSAGPSAQSSTKQILGWLICSERPLRWREIQSRFCIDVDDELCDPEDVRADGCKKLCSSLVDATDCELFPGVESEQTITMIHETASKYLIYTNTIDVMQEHIAMSLFCCRYLNSRPFFSAEIDELREVVETGYFGFMDYAASCYESHIKKSKLLMTDANSNSALQIKDALSNLEDTYHSTAPHNAADMHALAGCVVQPSKVLLQAIQDKVVNIRTTIHAHWDTLSLNTGFKELEGEKRHKCPKLHCSKFCVGFLNDALLRRHLTSHDRPFKCKDESCFAYIVGYASQKDLQLHSHSFHHDDSLVKIIFPGGNKTTEKDFINACKDGDLKKVRLLHHLGADLQGPSLQTSPLYIAFEAGHGHICKYLIQNGANPFGRSVTAYKWSPVSLVIERKNFHMLELFLFAYPGYTSSNDAWRIGPCVLDILRHYPPGVDIILRLLIIENESGYLSTYLPVVIEEFARFLVLWGQQMEATMFERHYNLVEHSNDTIAMHTKFREFFPNLYNHNDVLDPDPENQGYRLYQQALKRQNRLLHEAFTMKIYPFASFLMDIDIENVLQGQDSSGNSPLHSFIAESCRNACDGCVHIIERLIHLDSAGLAHQPNDNGHLPVHIAIHRNISPSILQTILKFTKDLNHKDTWGMTPLHYVQSKEILETLLQHKEVDLFCRNNEGQTRFARFCENDMDFDEDLMQLFLDRDITLAWTADEATQSLTPLHYAMIDNNWGEGRPSSAAKFLLNLSEVKQVLQAFSTSSMEDCKKVRDFAHEEDLWHALEIMDQIAFGLR
ncbi:hypothetical protein FPOAC2_04328 [Fusarium poae]